MSIKIQIFLRFSANQVTVCSSNIKIHNISIFFAEGEMYVFSFPKRDGAERRNVCLYLIGHVMSNNKVPILAPCTLIESQLNVRAQPKQLLGRES